MSGCRLTLSLFIISIVVFHVDARYILKGEGGGTFARTVYNELAFAYKYVKDNARVIVTATSSNQAVQSITQEVPTIDYATSYAVFHLEAVSNNPNIQVVPFLVSILVPAFYVPGIRPKDEQTGSFNGVILKGNVIADIYRGIITKWNDDRILVDNPSLLFPDETIQVIMRQDSDGATAVFTKALSSFVTDWQYPSASSWPRELLDLPNHHEVVGNYGMYSKVFSTNNSIGYVSLSDLYAQGIPAQEVNRYYIQIKNRRGDVVSAGYEEVKRSLENVIINKDFFVDTNDLSLEKAWPLIGISYVILRRDINFECDKRRELFKWFYWSKTDTEALSRVSNLGFANLEGFLLSKVLGYFTNATCDGRYLLDVREAPQRESSAFGFFFGLSIALLVISILMAFLWFYLNPNRGLKLVTLYFGLLVTGIVLEFISIIFWYEIPRNDSICLSRMWITGLGFTLILCAMFERSWQIHRVYTKGMKSATVTTNFISFFEIGGGIAILFLLQLVLLLLWTSVDPYSSTKNMTNQIDFEAVYSCSSEHTSIWLTLEMIYFFVLLIWGVWVVYATWSVKESINESRWMLICLYNQILVLGIAAAMIGTVEMSDDDIFLLAAPVIIFASMNTAIAIFGPLVVKILYHRVTGFSISDNTNARERKSGHSQTIDMSNINSNKM